MPGKRRPARPDPFEPLVGYCRARLADDPHLWAATLLDDVAELGYQRGYSTVGTGETPRRAAARELVEEARVSGELLPVPAAVTVRSYNADWSPTLGLSRAAVVDRDAPLRGEQGQPPRWFDLDETWNGAFPEDRGRIRAYVCRFGGRVIDRRSPIQPLAHNRSSTHRIHPFPWKRDS
ncbi:NUDIX domain-containing protein [Amycolatopsis sp. NPDC051128]|uniref:NUDIX hydrolase n=1 Tax=Amycolatopsis sp. NPDC051128 TaxID=3155412 RepID=UPI003448C190